MLAKQSAASCRPEHLGLGSVPQCNAPRSCFLCWESPHLPCSPAPCPPSLLVQGQLQAFLLTHDLLQFVLTLVRAPYVDLLCWSSFFRIVLLALGGQESLFHLLSQYIFRFFFFNSLRKAPHVSKITGAHRPRPTPQWCTSECQGIIYSFMVRWFIHSFCRGIALLLSANSSMLDEVLQILETLQSLHLTKMELRLAFYEISFWIHRVWVFFCLFNF